MLPLLRIRTLAGGGGLAAAAVSQQGLELRKDWPCLSKDGNVGTIQVHEDENMLTMYVSFSTR